MQCDVFCYSWLLPVFQNKSAFVKNYCELFEHHFQSTELLESVQETWRMKM